MLNEEVLQYIEEHWEEGYELLLTLAQIPAPSHHEEKRVEFCKNWLEAMGAEGVYVDEALNVVYPYQAEADKPLVVFMAHTDVVFPDTTPLPLKEEDGKICCPGVGDDTANLVALLLTARYVTQNHLAVKDCGILFVCNSCEEGMGNLKGSRKICETYGDRIKEFYSFDGTMGWLVNRAVGSARYRVTVKTRGGHSYGCFGWENAIAELASIIDDIYKIQVPEEGKITCTNGKQLTNPGNVASRPRITVKGTGTVTLSIAGQAIQLTDGGIVDSEAEDCFDLDEMSLANGRMTGDFPTLPVGTSYINWSAGTGSSVSSVVVEPRWRWV